MAQYINKRSRAKAIQRSFDLLCQYLNFGNDGIDTGEAGQVQAVLCGAYVRPFFEEYRRDYLMEAEEIEEIELHELVAWCQKKNAFHSKRYSYSQGTSKSAAAAAVDKSGWDPLDHAARFVVQVLQHSWEYDGAWSCGSWDPNSDEGDIEFWQVWLILRHLQVEWEAATLVDWTEESLDEMINQLSGTKM